MVPVLEKMLPLVVDIDYRILLFHSPRDRTLGDRCHTCGRWLQLLYVCPSDGSFARFDWLARKMAFVSIRYVSRKVGFRMHQAPLGLRLTATVQ